MASEAGIHAPFCSLPFVYRASVGQWEAVQLRSDYLSNHKLLSDNNGGSQPDLLVHWECTCQHKMYVADHPDALLSMSPDVSKSAIAALGFLLMAWPFVHDLVFDFFKMVQSLTPGRSKY